MNQFIKHCSLFLYLLVGSSLCAQDRVELKLPLSITERGMKVSSNISSIKIISSLAGSAFIGIVPSEVPNTRNVLEMPDGIQNCLQSFVDQQYGSLFVPSGTKILWSEDALSAGIDSSSSGVISFVKLGASILKLESSSDTYLQSGRFDTIIVSSKDNPNLGEKILTAINGLYNSSVLLASTNGKQSIGNAPASLKLQTAASYTSMKDLVAKKFPDWQILKDSLYPQGVYLSFQEFKDNFPSITNFVTRVDSTTTQVNIYQILADSSFKLISDPWGISLRNELYRYKEGQLYAVEKDQNGFSLSKYLDFRTRKNQGFYWRSMIGSQQGDNNPFDDKHIYRIPVTDDNPIKVETTKVDSHTGDLSF